MTMAALESPVLNQKSASKAAFVEALFDRIARRYDWLNDCISFGMHRGWKRKACAVLNLQPGQSVLDVCTGTGHLIDYLKTHVGPEGSVVGLDFSAKMLEVARAKFGKASHIKLVQGDALALPFADNTFNGAIMAFGLRNVDNPALALSQMQRVIQPGATLVILDTCSTPVLPGFWLYFGKLMPLLGRFLGKDQQAYEYLYQSTRQFLSPQALCNLALEQGLLNPQAQRLAFGTVTLLSAQKA